MTKNTVNHSLGERAIGDFDSSNTKETLAWLIERDGFGYLSVEHEQFKWTEDVNKAIRFCRREDAEMIGEIVLEDCDRIVEHMWMD